MKVRKKARKLFVDIEISASTPDDAAKALRGLASQFEADEVPLQTFGSDGDYSVSMTVEENWLKEEAKRGQDVEVDLEEDDGPLADYEEKAGGDFFRGKGATISKLRGRMLQ